MSDFNYQNYLKNNPLLQEEVIEDKLITEAKDKDIEESAPGFKHDCAAHVMHESHGYGLCLEGRHTLVETTEGNAEVTHYDVMFKNGEIVEKIPVNELKIVTSESHSHSKYEEDDVEEVMDIDRKGNKKSDSKDTMLSKAKKSMKEDEEIEEAEIELSQDEMDDLHKDGEVKKDDDVIKYKMKVSELKAKIKEDIISVLSEKDEEEIDIEDEVEMDMDVEEPKMDASDAQDGLTQDEKEIQDSLKIAYDNAVSMGDQKLADQIGNSITFFTRTHVVER